MIYVMYLEQANSQRQKVEGCLNIPIIFSHRTRTNNPKIHIEPQKTLNCQSNLEKKEQSRQYHSLRCHTVRQSYMIKAAYWCKHRHTDHCNSREHPEIHPHTDGQSMTKQARTHGGESLFHKCCWENWRNSCKTMRSELPGTIFKKKKKRLKMDERPKFNT